MFFFLNKYVIFVSINIFCTNLHCSIQMQTFRKAICKSSNNDLWIYHILNLDHVIEIRQLHKIDFKLPGANERSIPEENRYDMYLLPIKGFRT